MSCCAASSAAPSETRVLAAQCEGNFKAVRRSQCQDQARIGCLPFELPLSKRLHDANEAVGKRWSRANCNIRGNVIMSLTMHRMAKRYDVLFRQRR